MAGIGMLMVQSIIVTNPFFGESEIKRYLKLRRSFHDTFAEACEDLAEAIDSGRFGTGAKRAVRPLQMVGAIPAKQAQKALFMANRALKGLRRLDRNDFDDPRLFRLILTAERLDPAFNKDEYRRASDEYRFLLKGLLKVRAIPPAIRTLFRKALKHIGNAKPNETANPGAWFEMSPKVKDNLKRTAEKIEADMNEVFVKYKDEPEMRQTVFAQLQKRLTRVQNAAGVNLSIVLKGNAAKAEPIEKVLRREAKQQADGPTEFILGKVTDMLTEAGKYNPNKGMGKSVSREMGKVLTQIRKARSFDTVRRIVQDAVDRKVLGRSYVDDVEIYLAQAGKNLAVKRGAKLTPLQWEPIDAEDFQKKHSTGAIRFPDGTPKEKQRETLGRVSRAVEDLEGIFGKGFAGKHDKPLQLQFTGAAAFAKASYFAWDDRNNWQPRVRFGDDYEGLLAHELSHYFDDLLATKIDDALRPPDKQKPRYGGGGELFGRTGYSLEKVGASEGQMERFSGGPVPELAEFVTAVLESEDYARWKDMTGLPHELGVTTAIQTLTGKRAWDLPDGHPYAPFKNVDRMPRLKSDWPPELLAETEKAYKNMNDGDGRKLVYYDSGVEVWARMVEQYVYTRLADAGISNPWLTQLSYDLDGLPQMMDQDTFEKKVAPVLDRLFDRLKDRTLMARQVARRFTAYRLRPSDKKVITAFTNKQEAEGHVLSSDGRTLHKHGLGGEKVAVWRGPKIAIVSTVSGRSDMTIISYLTKVAGKGMVVREGLKFQTGGDALYAGQWDGWVTAYVPGVSQPVGRLDWSEYQGTYQVKMVDVDDDYRRSGIATALYGKLFKDQGITKRDLGPSMRTPEGDAFRRTLAT